MNPDSLVDQIRQLYAITSSVGTNGIGAYDYDTYSTSNISGASVAPWKEYTIKGEMLTATHYVDEHAVDVVGKDEIRRQLALQMASELLANKNIEFTQMRDNLTGKLIVKARVYVVPDSQVRILRTNGA